MGANHGGHGTSPHNFEWGDANANCPEIIKKYPSEFTHGHHYKRNKIIFSETAQSLPHTLPLWAPLLDRPYPSLLHPPLRSSKTPVKFTPTLGMMDDDRERRGRN